MLHRDEYVRIQALANGIASLAKEGLKGYDTYSVNTHINLDHSIAEFVNEISAVRDTHNRRHGIIRAQVGEGRSA